MILIVVTSYQWILNHSGYDQKGMVDFVRNNPNKENLVVIDLFTHKSMQINEINIKRYTLSTH